MFLSLKNKFLLSKLLLLSSLVMAFEAIYYISAIRIIGAENFWSISSVFFSKFFMQLWGSACMFLAIIFYIFSKKIEHYLNLTKIVGIWFCFHSFILLKFSFLSWSQAMPSSVLPSFLPKYELFLALEFVALMALGISIIYLSLHIKHKK